MNKSIIYGLMLCLLMTSVSAYVTSQPVHYWEMGDATGLDSIGTFHATSAYSSPATSSTAISGNSTYFTSDALSWNNTGDIDFGQSWSLNVWARKSVFAGSTQELLQMTYGDSSNRFRLYTDSSDQYEAYWLNSTGDANYIAGDEFGLDEWVMLTMVNNQEADTISYYINGSLVSSHYDADIYSPAPTSWVLAKDNDNAQFFFIGWLDEMTWWDYALSTDEMSYLYNNGSDIPTYPFSTSDNHVQLTFYDQTTTNLIDDRLVTTQLFGESAYYSNTTSTGYLNISDIVSGTYTGLFSAENYSDAYLAFVFDDTTYIQDVYLLANNESGVLRLQVVDQYGNYKENANVKVQRYFTSTNSYTLVDEQITDSNGRANTIVTATSVFYRFVVEVDGTTVLTTTPSAIDEMFLDSEENIYVLQYYEEDTTFQTFFGVVQVDYNISFNTATNNFLWFYNDVNNDISEGCLYVYRITAGEQTLINSSCVSSTTASILVPASAINGSTWVGAGYVTYNGTEIYLDSLQYKYPEDVSFGGNTLFALIGLTLIVGLAFVFRPVIMLIVLPLPLLMFSILGLVNIPYGIAIVLEVIAIVLGAKMSK